MNKAEAERYVDEVWHALTRIDEREYQDQLDVLLLGGTVPATPIPQPDPECRDCWGYGKVCPCHGVCAAHGPCGPDDWRTAHLSLMNTEACDCIKKQRRQQRPRPRPRRRLYEPTDGEAIDG